MPSRRGGRRVMGAGMPVSNTASVVHILFTRSKYTAMAHAFPHQIQAGRPSKVLTCGCTPSSTKGLQALRNSAASSTTVVVPSPTCTHQTKGRGVAN